MNPLVYVTYWGHRFDHPVGVVLPYSNPISTQADIDSLREMLGKHLDPENRYGSFLPELISWRRLEDTEQ